MGVHLIGGEFQSDKYPSTPRGKVPLSVKDPDAQNLLWEYAQRRRGIDAEFSDDLETALRTAGYEPSVGDGAVVVHRRALLERVREEARAARELHVDYHADAQKQLANLRAELADAWKDAAR